MHYLQAIETYKPQTAQEEADRSLILQMIETFGKSILTRDCRAFHMTGSGFIFNAKRSHCLMIYHNLYQSWSYTGGHADGDPDLMAVAVREAEEETGITGLIPLSEGIVSLDILPVFGHVKKGIYISSHLHFSAVYAFTADDTLPLQIKPDENSRVGWIPVDRLEAYCTEAHMLPVYEKVIRQFKIKA